jgi:hypothetical protein
MIQIFEEDNPIKASLKRAAPIFLGDGAEAVIANVKQFEKVRDLAEKQENPILFYGFDSELSLLHNGSPAAPYFYSKMVAYFQVPFELVKMRDAYQAIIKGEKIENPAVMLIAKAGHKKNLVGQLLHDLYPGKWGAEKGLETAKREFGITGTIEEVRTQLENLRESEIGSVAKLAGDMIFPGVFCDIENTLIIDQPNAGSVVNKEVFEKLKEFSKTLPITLWTGGDLRNAERYLMTNGINQWPLVSKYDFAGAKVEIVIDDLFKKEFQERYNISYKEYIRV